MEVVRNYLGKGNMFLIENLSLSLCISLVGVS